MITKDLCLFAFIVQFWKCNKCIHGFFLKKKKTFIITKENGTIVFIVESGHRTDIHNGINTSLIERHKAKTVLTTTIVTKIQHLHLICT